MRACVGTSPRAAGVGIAGSALCPRNSACATLTEDPIAEDTTSMKLKSVTFLMVAALTMQVGACSGDAPAPNSEAAPTQPAQSSAEAPSPAPAPAKAAAEPDDAPSQPVAESDNAPDPASVASSSSKTPPAPRSARAKKTKPTLNKILPKVGKEEQPEQFTSVESTTAATEAGIEAAPAASAGASAKPEPEVIADAKSAPPAGQGDKGEPAAEKIGPPRSPEDPPNLLFITLDTTRADHIGCYGFGPAKTETIDSVAKRGVLFESAIAQVPLTLPSHTCMFTGKYPMQTRVLTNLRNTLAEEHTTLAEVLKAGGYDTGAFIAASVLESAYGLDQGFNHYWSEFQHENSLVFEDHHTSQHTADVVTDKALAWLKPRAGTKWAAWVHYYDPHKPYTPPSEFLRVNASADDYTYYDGEIAFVDTQVRRLIEFLSKENLDDDTVVVIVGDHGEAFGELGEEGHGIFLSQAVLHVPLIIYHPALAAGGQRFPDLFELVDLFPTVLDMLGLDTPAGIAGRSFAPLLRGEEVPAQVAYSESVFGTESFNWAEQRSLISADGAWKYIHSTDPSLYHLAEDPTETEDVSDAHPEEMKAFERGLRDLFAQIPKGEVTVAKMDAETLEKLAGLGYSGGGPVTEGNFLTPGLADPKSKLQDLDLITLARDLTRGTAERTSLQALPMWETLYQRNPDAFEIIFSLGALGIRAANVLRQEGGAENAAMIRETVERSLELFDKALKIDPNHWPSHINRGIALGSLGRHEEAIEAFELGLGFDDGYPVAAATLAASLEETGRYAEAMKWYRRAAEIDPKMASAYIGAGRVHIATGNPADAIGFLLRAEQLSPSHESAYNVGIASMMLGEYDRAAAALTTARKRDPNHAGTIQNLATVKLLQGDQEGAKRLYRMALAHQDTEAVAAANLGTLLVREGDTEQGEKLLRRALELEPFKYETVAEYFAVLRDSRRYAEAVTLLRATLQGLPGDRRMLMTLADLLATCPDDSVRSGDEAVAMARRAMSASEDHNPAALGTLAAAYAEAGDFDRASETAQEAIDLANKMGAGDTLLGDLRDAKALYDAGKPLRKF